MAKDKNSIMFDVDDPRSAKIAEVLSNKTAKKILNSLSEGEKSESELGKELGIALNTVGYNVKKLESAGLIDKVGGFLWSVKGKRIHKYKLANRRIIIAPKRMVGKALPLALIAAVLVAILLIASFGLDRGGVLVEEDKLRTFASQSELNAFLEENSDVAEAYYAFDSGGVSTAAGAVPSGAAAVESAGAVDYSETNIQVEGVDEPDIVKNDGKYIYSVSEGKVKIVDAFPASGMEIVSEIEIEGTLREIFVNDDKLIVFGWKYEFAQGSVPGNPETEVGRPAVDSAGIVSPGYYTKAKTIVFIYDISDRENPELEKEIEADGEYVDSRMIGDYVYVISTDRIRGVEPPLPMFEVDGVERRVGASEIHYFDYPDRNYVFTSIMALNVDEGDFESQVYLTGSTRTIFVSENNIYLTYMKRVSQNEYIKELIEEVIIPILPRDVKAEVNKVMKGDKSVGGKWSEVGKIVEQHSRGLIGKEKAEFDEDLRKVMIDFQVKMQKKTERTVVHKIGIEGNMINYEAVGEIPGRVLNQFSMGEKDGYFRAATTAGHVSRGGDVKSVNNVYVLNEDLEIVGSVEDLAPGERIYSARFIGDRAYLVTFKKVDPFYVIDLGNPRAPKVLGYLKIPGYSDYLHPYDENHVIGIGKWTEASDSGNFAWYQGVKISVFDVSDVSNPVESANIILGDRGSDSYALRDHKAFLFDKEKGILVIPASLAKIDTDRYCVKRSYIGVFDDEVYEHFIEKMAIGGTPETFEGATPEAYLSLFPGLEENDFNGVKTNSGHYSYREGKLIYEGEETNSASKSISDKGLERLLDNLAYKYVGDIIDKDDVDSIILAIEGEDVEFECNIPPNAFGQVYWQGAMVLDISEDSISERGRITHYDDSDFEEGKFNRWYWGGQKAVQRSLYMDDVLYTISQSKVKANDLSTIEEINSVDLIEDGDESDIPILY